MFFLIFRGLIEYINAKSNLIDHTLYNFMILKYNKILGKGCRMSIKYACVARQRVTHARLTSSTDCMASVCIRHWVNKHHSLNCSFLISHMNIKYFSTLINVLS